MKRVTRTTGEGWRGVHGQGTLEWILMMTFILAALFFVGKEMKTGTENAGTQAKDMIVSATQKLKTGLGL